MYIHITITHIQCACAHKYIYDHFKMIFRMRPLARIMIMIRIVMTILVVMIVVMIIFLILAILWAYNTNTTNTVDFRNFIVFFWGRDPGTLKSDIVSTKTSAVNLFGCETLKLTIRRLKLWKPTVEVCPLPFPRLSERHPCADPPSARHAYY